MSAAPKLRLSEAEYLRRERAAVFRSEFYRGEMFAMAGASREHNLVSGNLFTSINYALRERSCEAYTGDMRVKVAPTGLYTYPDVTVVCGVPRFEDDHGDTLVNPTVLIEVLSESTEAYDRGEKWAQYRQLPSLKEYVLASQITPHCEVYRRQPDGRWLLTDAVSLEAVVSLESIGVEIPLSEVYRKVEFPQDSTQL